MFVQIYKICIITTSVNFILIRVCYISTYICMNIFTNLKVFWKIKVLTIIKTVITENV